MISIVINSDWCKGCELCVEFCRRGVLALSLESNKNGYHPAQVVSPASCNGCKRCATMCPEAVITLTKVS